MAALLVKRSIGHPILYLGKHGWLPQIQLHRHAAGKDLKYFSVTTTIKFKSYIEQFSSEHDQMSFITARLKRLKMA